MKSQMPFEYTVIQYFHDPETGEFINVGLIMYSPVAHFFASKVLLKYRRITQAFPDADGEIYRMHLGQIQKSLDKVGKRINDKRIQSSFLADQGAGIVAIAHEVIPPSNASIRISEPKFGASYDLESTFDFLFFRMVEKHLKERDRSTRNDEDVWQHFRQSLEKSNVASRLSRYSFSTPIDTFEFEQTWKNGKWNVLKPISFDLVKPGSIRAKAKEWLGTEQLLSKYAEQLGQFYFLLGAPQDQDNLLQKAYADAKTILCESDDDRFHIVEEQQAEDFASEIKEGFH